MEPCAQCGSPTSLFFQGKPVCIDCDRKREGPDNSVPMKKPPQAASGDRIEFKEKSDKAAG